VVVVPVVEIRPPVRAGDGRGRARARERRVRCHDVQGYVAEVFEEVRARKEQVPGLQDDANACAASMLVVSTAIAGEEGVGGPVFHGAPVQRRADHNDIYEYLIVNLMTISARLKSLHP